MALYMLCVRVHFGGIKTQILDYGNVKELCWPLYSKLGPFAPHICELMPTRGALY